tara:strand:+ start:7351 stop:7632 length:282 start_codon:yes stop_codon:yes gene_type:complete
MKEFKGTQGEWKAVKIKPTKYHKERNEIHYGDDGECIAEFVHNEHDAKLIAAAPKLLKALIKINELAECSDDRFSNYSDEIYNYSSEAINEAL